ncbi:MAG: sensor domain-containing protein [Psychrobium sp.]
MTFETGEEMSTHEQIDSALFDTTASFEISISKHFDLSLMSVDDLTLSLFSLDTQSDFDEFFRHYMARSLAHGLTHLHRTAQDRSCFRVPFSITTDSLHIDSILLLNVQENYHKAIVHIVDLTQFSEAKFQLEELMLRYELVVEGAFGAIWDWDLVNKSVHFSESWCQLRGGTKSDFTGAQNEWVESVHPDDLPRIMQAVEDHFVGKTEVFEEEYRIVDKQGGVTWIVDRGIAKRNAQGEVIRMAGSEFDITEQRAHREELKLAASVFENITEAAVILDAHGFIINVNEAFNQLFYSQDVALDKMHFSEIFSISQRKIIKDLLSTHPIKWSGETQIHTLNHDAIACKLTVNHVKSGDEITHFVCLLADISETKKTQSLLYDLAYKDALTGLPNRLSLNSYLMSQIRQYRETNKQLALLFIDLDNFKFVNDSLGHKAGDGIVKKAARIISDVMGEDCFISRLGGDEFVVVLPINQATNTAQQAAERLVSNLKHRVDIQDKKVMVSASIGISIYPNDGVDSDTLIQHADAAMYQAKERGKQTYQFYTQCLTQKAMDRMQLEANIDQAIAREEFVLHYQPQIDIATDKIIGVEALIRWQPHEHPLIYPDQFITLAEENNTIIEIGHWVLRTACQQAQQWLDSGLMFGAMSVNVSAKQLQSDELINHVKNALLVSGLAPHYLELEITESFILHQPDDAIARLHKLCELGVTLAIDDFGTGYSSLSYLKRLPVHRLKIDRSFIGDIPQDTNDTAITQAIIVMAEQLGLAIIAEGVETQEQAQFLLRNKCSQAQGYLYSKPLDSLQAEAFISKKSSLLV